jgi:hypothetical protein
MNGAQNINGLSGPSPDNQGMSLQLASQIINSALSSALASHSQQSADQNADQLRFARSQGLNNTQMPNQMLLQQLGLQSLFQPPQLQPQLLTSQALDSHNANNANQVRELVPPSQNAVTSGRIPPSQESKRPSSVSRKGESEKPKSQISSIVPCRARGMPAGHNSSVRSHRGYLLWGVLAFLALF